MSRLCTLSTKVTSSCSHPTRHAPDGGTEADAAETHLGLARGTKLLPSGTRRGNAALAYNVTVDHFRKRYEPQLFAQVAEAVLAVCRQRQLRQTHTQMEQRHPADSRLAVQWIERFEAYYRI